MILRKGQSTTGAQPTVPDPSFSAATMDGCKGRSTVFRTALTSPISDATFFHWFFTWTEYTTAKTKYAAAAETSAQPRSSQLRPLFFLWHLLPVKLEDGTSFIRTHEGKSTSGQGWLRHVHYLSHASDTRAQWKCASQVSLRCEISKAFSHFSACIKPLIKTLRPASPDSFSSHLRRVPISIYDSSAIFSPGS